MSNIKKIEQIKLDVIYNSLMHQKTKEQRFKLEAISNLKVLLNYYHIANRKTVKKDFNESLIKFSGWNGGANVINDLLNAF